MTIHHPWGKAAVSSQNGRDLRPQILRNHETRLLAGIGTSAFTDCAVPTNRKSSARGDDSQRADLQADGNCPRSGSDGSGFCNVSRSGMERPDHWTNCRSLRGCGDQSEQFSQLPKLFGDRCGEIFCRPAPGRAQVHYRRRYRNLRRSSHRALFSEPRPDTKMVLADSLDAAAVVLPLRTRPSSAP